MKNVSTMISLLRWLQPRERTITQLLGRFVRAGSPSFDKAAVDCFGEMVAAEWRKRGDKITRIPQKHRGDHVKVEWRSRQKASNGQILVIGHLDTVYDVGTIARMPFRVSRGRAWGPGTLDMKGGLVIALLAMDALVANALSPKKNVVFLWTSDEEIGSESSRAHIEREAKRSDAVLVLEPAAGLDGGLKTGRKGVGEIELIVTGRAAHAGLNPQDGVNAIQELALQTVRISSWNRPERGITVSVGTIEGGTRSNVIPERSRVLVDVRADRVKDMGALEAKFRSLQPILVGAKLEVRGGFNRPPLERKMTMGLFERARAMGREMGVDLGSAHVGGASDGNFTAALGVPTLDGLGAVGEGAHSANENIVIRELPARAALLAGLISRL